MYPKSTKQKRAENESATTHSHTAPTHNHPNQKQNKRDHQNDNRYGNRPFEEALGSVRRDGPPKTARNPQNFIDLPAVNQLANDGIDHINIHPSARTNLGRALSAYGESVFMHNRWGRFLTVHGFMSWLSNPKQPDNFRTMSGTRVERAMFKQATGAIPNYHFVFMDATWQKIKANKELCSALAQCELPFDHYYYQTVSKDPLIIIRSRVQASLSLIRGMNELRCAVREDREPNLAFLLAPQDRVEYLRNLERGCSTLELSFLGGPSQISLEPEPNEGYDANTFNQPPLPKKKKKTPKGPNTAKPVVVSENPSAVIPPDDSNGIIPDTPDNDAGADGSTYGLKEAVIEVTEARHTAIQQVAENLEPTMQEPNVDEVPTDTSVEAVVDIHTPENDEIRTSAMSKLVHTANHIEEVVPTVDAGVDTTEMLGEGDASVPKKDGSEEEDV